MTMPYVIDAEIKNERLTMRFRMYCGQCNLVGAFKSESAAMAESQQHNEAHHSPRTVIDAEGMWVP